MKTIHRAAALFLSLLMLCQLLPIAALAEGTAEYRGPSAVYSITFGDKTYLIPEGNTITEFPFEPEPDEGKVFLGWFDGDTKVELPFTPTRDMMLTAKFEDAANLVRTLDFDMADGAVISLTGLFPEDCDLTVTDTAAKRVMFKAMKAAGPDMSESNLYTYDIQLTNPDGSEYQPESGIPVKVTVRGQKFADTLAEGRSIRLVHQLDDNTKEEITDLDVSRDTVSFEVDHFSSFIFTGKYDLVNWQSALTAGNTDISLSGVMPNGATAAALSAAPAVEEGAVLAAADITLYNSDVKVQPSAWGGELTVTLTSQAIANARQAGSELHVVHIDDNGAQTMLDDALLSFADNSVTFPADQFSVYAVVAENTIKPEARATINFFGKDQEHPLTTVYVKNSDDLAQTELIIYDPGAGQLANNDLFRGWKISTVNTTDAKIYTLEDEPNAMTIEEVQQFFADFSETGVKTIKEGDVYNIYALIYQAYEIEFRDEEGIVVFSETKLTLHDQPVDYTINVNYTPKGQNQQFLGWKVAGGYENNVAPKEELEEEGLYPNQTEVEISGHAIFLPYAPEGRWLVFHENGKGATYCAPQFVKNGDVTKKPFEDEDMTRKGYTFAGWYTGAPAEGSEEPTGSLFEFGRVLNEETHLYAKWTPNTDAPYTVIFWTQNQARDGYDLRASYPGTGEVGHNIPYTYNSNVDEGYVTVNGTTEGHYTGFCLKPEDAYRQIEITPEGDAVLNLYYDRIQYELRFIYYRERNSNRDKYSYATGSNDGKNLWGIADWSGNGNTRPTQSYGAEETVRINDSTGDYTAHYFTLTAYYGDDISTQWPTYDKLGNAGGNAPVSFVMMNGTGLKGNSVTADGYGDGRDTVKGIITRMDEQILAYTNDADGNYLIIRYAGYNDWHYHLYFETIDGQSYPTDTNPQHPSPKTLQLNNKTYYYDRTVTSRSSNVSPDMQNPPSFAGFEVVKKAGSNVDEYYDNTGNHASNSNPYQTGYHGDDGPYLSYYYNRLAYPVTYMDGVYVDKDNEPITSHTNQELHVSEEDVPYGASTAGYASYVPQITDTLEREGYVFEGWYADAACRTPMVWTTMPIGGIRVYAKWRQIQYRVFLHPNAGNAASDPGLDWGSEGVSTSFRVEYGQKVSTPYGRGRPEYEFVGWYWDAAFTRPYNSENTILNNGTITSSSAFTYSKTEPTELDKWGNPGTDTSNHDVDRFWVTRKLDLYAKWRLKIEGARGIRVVYTANESETVTGTNAPYDPLYYLDEAGAIGGAASTPDDEKLQFLHWVVQKWDENSQKFVDTRQIVYPAGTFIVYKRDTRKEDNPDYTVGGSEDEFIYTIQLRPQYGPKDAPTPTHLTWYDNFTENPVVNTNYFTDNDLQINEAVPIKPAATFIRPGYKFLGWARVPTTDNSGTQIPGYSLSPKELDEDDLFLTYHENTNTFTAVVSGEETTVTKVAADEKFPYHDLYAVWKRWVPTIYYVMLTDGTQAVTKITNFKYYNYNTQATGLGIGSVSPPVQGMEIATPAAWNFVNTPIQLSRNNPPTGTNSFSAPEAFDSQMDPTDSTKYGSVRFVNMGVATLGANGTLTYPTVRNSVLYMRFMENTSTHTCYYEYSTDGSTWNEFTEDMVLYAIYSEATKISVSKAWNNMNNGVVVNDTPPTGATVTFRLYQKIGAGDTAATDYTVTLDGTVDSAPTTIGGYESEPWKATFVELPVVDNNGTLITYYIAESAGYAGYEASTTDPVADGGTITNTQKRDTLTVSKTVSGNMSEMTREFSYVLSVTGNYVNPNLTATKTAADGTTSSVSFTLTQSGSAYTRSFTLKHGESLLIPDLPDQADVTISETAAPYTPYYRINTAETETQGSSCTFTLTGETTVFFRNNFSQIPDTGVRMDTIPYLLILALCALGLEALRRRRVKGGM